MPLKYTQHREESALEEELRALWRQVDGLAQRQPGSSVAAKAAELGGVVKSWSFRLDSNSTFGPNGVSQGSYEVATIHGPSFTHLELHLAMEKVSLGGSGLSILLSLSADGTIERFNGAAGPSIPWTLPLYDTSPSGSYIRGASSIYEFFLTSGSRIKRIEPAIVGTNWTTWDKGFFPITLAGGASATKLMLTRSVSNASASPRSVCLRGYLTGRYIEHAQPVSNTWLCSSI